MKKGWSSFMDRRVKERLVGATILMVLAVLIVPELLSGPKRAPKVAPPTQSTVSEPVRNVTVDLTTNKQAPAEDDTASAAAPSSQAETDSVVTSDASASQAPMPQAAHEPVTPPSIATLQAQQPAPQGSLAVENSPSIPKSAPPSSKNSAPHAVSRDLGQADGSHHRWAAQIGSFASRANAEKLEHQLKAQSFSAYIVSSGAGRSLLYRVRVGPMPDRAAAERVIAKLHKEGHTASVVTP